MTWGWVNDDRIYIFVLIKLIPCGQNQQMHAKTFITVIMPWMPKCSCFLLPSNRFVKMDDLLFWWFLLLMGQNKVQTKPRSASLSQGSNTVWFLQQYVFRFKEYLAYNLFLSMFDWSLCPVSASVTNTCRHTGTLQKLLWWRFLTASLTHQYHGHYEVLETLKSSEISAKSSSDLHHVSHHHFHPPINSPFFTVCSKIQTIVQQNLTLWIQSSSKECFKTVQYLQAQYDSCPIIINLFNRSV